MPADARHTTRLLALSLAASLGAFAGTAAADDDDAMRRVGFQVERSREVANNWVRATVSVTAENADPARLADEINQTMAWALDLARDRKGVEVESGGYRTHPIHEKGRLRRWRGSQDLRLEGADFEAVTGLVGELQSRLQLQSLHFSVSPERRRGVEDELIGEALDAFRGRAEIVKGKLGAGGYEIVRLDVNTGGGLPRPMRHDMAVMRAAAEVAPPAVEGGTSRIVVGVSATIELD